MDHVGRRQIFKSYLYDLGLIALHRSELNYLQHLQIPRTVQQYGYPSLQHIYLLHWKSKLMYAISKLVRHSRLVYASQSMDWNVGCVRTPAFTLPPHRRQLLAEARLIPKIVLLLEGGMSSGVLGTTALGNFPPCSSKTSGTISARFSPKVVGTKTNMQIPIRPQTKTFLK